MMCRDSNRNRRGEIFSGIYVKDVGRSPGMGHRPERVLLTLHRSFAAAMSLLLGACSLPDPDVVPAAAAPGAAARPALPADAWPDRLEATTPSFAVNKGAPPRDLGVYRQCRVMLMSQSRKEAPLLFFASRTSEPIYEPKGHLGVSLEADENSTSFVVRDHRITLIEVEPSRIQPARGTVIYLASIMGLPKNEQQFITSLREAGWNVASCLPSLDLFYRDGWPDVIGEDGFDEAAQRLARRIDGHLAERAYAVESLLAYLAADHPDWLKGPRVVIGSSAGALALPAVAARVGNVDAAVLIGGGAHVPRILMESWIDIYNPVMRRGPDETRRKRLERRLNRDERRKLQKLAFEHCRLDPAHLAPLLRGVPTLQMHATRDRVVPAQTGELLHGALGRPERWDYAAGHVSLFYGLPTQAGRVIDWLDAQTR